MIAAEGRATVGAAPMVTGRAPMDGSGVVLNMVTGTAEVETPLLAAQSIGYGLVITVNGESVIPYMLDGAWAVERDLDQPVNQLTLPRLLVGGLADLLAVSAPPGGLDSWSVAIRVGVPGAAPREYRLMTDGMSISGGRESVGPGAVETVAVHSRLSRYREIPVTVRLRAGHNLPIYRVIETLAKAAGYPVVNIPRRGSIRVLHPVEVIRSGWLDTASVLAETLGWRIVESTGGTLSMRSDDPLVAGPVRHFRGPDRIVYDYGGQAQVVRIGSPDGALSAICGTAQLQVTRDEDSGSVVLPSVAFGRFAPVAAPWLQSGAGTRTIQAWAEQPVADRIRSRTETVITREAGAVVSEETQGEGWHNPVAAARTLNGDGTTASYRTVYLSEDSETASSFRHVHERFGRTDRATTSREYASSGELRRVVQEIHGYRITRRHVRSRVLRSDDWETATGPAGLLVLGDGTGVTETESTLRLIQRTITEVASVDGYQTYERREIYGYRLRPGWQYLYADGSESMDSQEQWGLVRTEEDFWLFADREGEYIHRWQHLGPDGRLLEGEERPAGEERLEGQPPAVETAPSPFPVLADFETVDEWRDALAAHDWETKQIVSRRTASGVQRPALETETSLSYAQSPQHLGRMLDRLLLASQEPPVSWTELFDPGMHRGDLVHVRLPSMRLDHTVRVRSIRVHSPDGIGVLADISGKVVRQ